MCVRACVWAGGWEDRRFSLSLLKTCLKMGFAVLELALSLFFFFLSDMLFISYFWDQNYSPKGGIDTFCNDRIRSQNSNYSSGWT